MSGNIIEPTTSHTVIFERNESNSCKNNVTFNDVCNHFNILTDNLQFYSIPLTYLSNLTIDIISSLLSRKVLFHSGDLFSRNWKGLAHYLEFQEVHIYCWSHERNPARRVLQEWTNRDGKKATISKLINLYVRLQRCDFLLFEVSKLLKKDVSKYWKMVENYNANLIGSPKSLQPLDNESDRDLLTKDDFIRRNQGLGVQIYDAFVLYVDEDIEFATELISVLEREYDLKLCVRDREIRCSFLLDYSKVMKLISERCKKVVIIITEAFLKSDIHRYFFIYANSLSIQHRRCIIIPCIYDDCKAPNEISICNKLYYRRSSKLWNFWDKLNESIKSQISPINNLARLSNEEFSINIPIKRQSRIENMGNNERKQEITKSETESVKSTLSILFDENTPIRRSGIQIQIENTSKKKYGWLKKVIPHHYYDYKHSKKQKKIEKFTKQLQSLALVH